MKIEDPDATTEADAFRTRIRGRLAEQGGRAGFASGETFKLMPDL
jgi:hypothetical protein